MTWQDLVVLACVFGAFVLGALCAGVKRREEAWQDSSCDPSGAPCVHVTRDLQTIQEAWATYIRTIDLYTPEGGHGPRHEAFARYWALCEEYGEIWGQPVEGFPHAPTHGRSSNTAEIRGAIKPPIDADYAIRAAWCDGREGVVLGHGAQETPCELTCELTWDELCERYYVARTHYAGVPLWAAMEAMHEGKFMPIYKAWCAYLSGIEARNHPEPNSDACNARNTVLEEAWARS